MRVVPIIIWVSQRLKELCSNLVALKDYVCNLVALKDFLSIIRYFVFTTFNDNFILFSFIGFLLIIVI